MSTITETQTNIISEGTRVEGNVVFSHITRVHGTLVGEINSIPGSMLILGETSVLEGNLQADRLIVDGFVRGDIKATGRVVISRTGRVIGNIQTPSLLVEYGAFFEGKCTMNS